MTDKISQDSRLVTARRTLQRAAGKPDLPALADQLTYWAGTSGELRAALAMVLDAFTFTEADRRLLSDVFSDAGNHHVEAWIACPDCDAADRSQTGGALCDQHRPGMARLTAYDAMAARLAALGLLPDGPQGGTR